MRWPAVAAAFLLATSVGAGEPSSEQVLGKAATWSVETEPVRSDPSLERVEPPVAATPKSQRCAIDDERLGRARAQLGAGAIARPLGRHELFTDVRDDRLLELLDGLARRVEEAYAGTLGLPVAEHACRAAVVLFASETSYATLAEAETHLPAEVGFLGHTGGGVATLFAGSRTHQEVGSTLVHELTHLLNAQLLGPELPHCLDEGLALYLGTAQISSRGALDLDHIDWQLVPLGGNFRGPADFLGWVARSLPLGQVPSIAELAALDRTAFLNAKNPQQLAAYSFLWVRFLLGSGDPLLEQGFRRFLAAFAAGEPPALAALVTDLGRSWPEVEGALLLWLAQMRHHRELGVG